MDLEQEEMQFLGLFGIYTEAYKIIFSWRKIFTKITLALILPLSFILLAHMQISDVLFADIMHDEIKLDETSTGSPSYHKVSHVLSSEWTMFWLFKAAYLTFLLIFSLLSTSAVVYTIACIYTARNVTFRKVMSVVPKVWRRLMVTFLCAFSMIFVYNIVAIIIFILWVIFLGPTTIGFTLLVIISILYLVGFIYISIIWHLASVISVLEEAYGVQAMVKSKALVKGKMVVAIVIFFMLTLSFGAVQVLFEKQVVHGYSHGMGSRIAYGILCLVLYLKLILFGLVVQTVIYFVCKSYHHENIDKSALSDHLEVYLGEYVPLKTKDVQLEHFYV